MYFGSLPNSCTWHFYRTTTNTCWCTWAVLAVFLATLPFPHPAVGRTSSEFPWTSQHVIRVPRRYCPEIAGLMLHVILHPQIDPNCINTKTRSSKGANQFPRNSRGNVTHYPPSPNWSRIASTAKAKRCKPISQGGYLLGRQGYCRGQG